MEWTARSMFICSAVFIVVLTVVTIRYNISEGMENLATYRQEDTWPEKVKLRDEAVINYVEGLRSLTHVVDLKTEARSPDINVIGLWSCGSNLLAQMISQHPRVKSITPRKKKTEVLEFETLMQVSSEPDILEKRLQQIHLRMPKAKLVAVLCDPVNRTFSQVVSKLRQEKADMVQGRTIDALLHTKVKTLAYVIGNLGTEFDISQLVETQQDNISEILATGIYHQPLRRWFGSLYDRSQFTVVDGEKLRTEPWNVVNELQDFFGIPRYIIKEDFVKDSKNGAYCLMKPGILETRSRKMLVNDANSTRTCMDSKENGRTARSYQPSQDTVDEIREFYKRHNEKLFKLLDKRFNWQ